MPEWTVPTGSGGLLKMSDNGTTVKFYIKAGSTATFCNDKAFSWNTAHDSDGSGTFDYPTGGAWLLVKTVTVTQTGTVSFTMGATGTSGLGGPTTISHSVSRSSKPDPPAGVPYGSDAGQTKLSVNFSATPDSGGALVAAYDIQYGANDFTQSFYKQVPPASLLGNVLTALKPATEYVFRVYTITSYGRSDPGSVGSYSTLANLSFKTGGAYKKVMMFIKTGGVYKQVAVYVKYDGHYAETGI